MVKILRENMGDMLFLDVFNQGNAKYTPKKATPNTPPPPTPSSPKKIATMPQKISTTSWRAEIDSANELQSFKFLKFHFALTITHYSQPNAHA